jgi:hypothetical protein
VLRKSRGVDDISASQRERGSVLKTKREGVEERCKRGDIHVWQRNPLGPLLLPIVWSEAEVFGLNQTF